MNFSKLKRRCNEDKAFHDRIEEILNEEKWIDDKYQKRICITIDTTQTIKDGFTKWLGDFLPATISKENEKDMIVTRNGKILEIVWGWNNHILDKNNKIVIDDTWNPGYQIFFPIKRDVGKVEYYIYYNISNNATLGIYDNIFK